MGVHAAPVDAFDRLGHERRDVAEAAGNVANHELEGGEIVGRGERIGVPEVDLMLAGRHFVMGRLHLEAHFDQLLHNDSPDLLAPVERTQVEVGGRIVGDGGRRSVRRLLEHEELGFAAGHHGKAELPRPFDLTLEGGAGTAGKGLLVRGEDVAEQPGHPAALIIVGKDPEGVEIRLEQHVGLLDPDESLDRGAVEHDLAVQGLLELAAGHLDVLVHAQDVGELQPQKIHAEALGQLEDVVLSGAAQIARKAFEGRTLGGGRVSLRSLGHA